MSPNSGRIKIESEHFLIYDVPGDGQYFLHALSLAITGNLSQSLVYNAVNLVVVGLYFVNGHFYLYFLRVIGI
jgi:hypothetical protein